MRVIDLTGIVFGNLTVIEISRPFRKPGKSDWLCQCICGLRRVVTGADLNSGQRSCGCQRANGVIEAIAKKYEGRRFGKLVAVRREKYNGKMQWLCICDCGNTTHTMTTYLTLGHTQSCGCKKREGWQETVTTHGLTRRGNVHPLFVTWCQMRYRCYSPKNCSYPDYGGRGIKVCDAWLEDFSAFVADMGPRPKGMQLERNDNDGNYEPGNCRWATPKEQANNRRTTILLEHKGVRLSVNGWSEKLGIPSYSLSRWLQRGATIPDIVAGKIPYTRAK